MFKRYVYRNYRSFSSFKYRAERRVTPTGWVVLVSAVLTASLGVDTTLALAYQTFTFLFGLLVVAVIGARFSGRRFAVERALPRLASVGEPLRYRLILRSPSGKSLKALTVIEDMPDPRPSFEEFLSTPEPGEAERNWFDRTYGYYRFMWLMGQRIYARPQEQAVQNVPPRGEREVEMELMPLRRGVLRLTGVTAAYPDPLGFFRALRTVPLPQSVLILPKRYSIPPFELPGTMKYQQGGVSLASSVGESEEFVSLREYRPGDPLRRLHWKSFAKIGKPIVKEYQEEFFVRHALALDTFSSHAYSDVFEEAVSVAASLAFSLQDHDSLLDLMFVGPEAYCFTSGRGVAHTEQMLEILAAVQLCRNKTFDALADLAFNHVAQMSGCVCVFIEWDEARRSFVQKLRSMGIPLLVFVITATETTLDAGPMADQPNAFHVLPLGRVGEVLGRLGAAPTGSKGGSQE